MGSSYNLAVELRTSNRQSGNDMLIPGWSGGKSDGWVFSPVALSRLRFAVSDLSLVALPSPNVVVQHADVKHFLRLETSARWASATFASQKLVFDSSGATGQSPRCESTGFDETGRWPVVHPWPKAMLNIASGQRPWSCVTPSARFGQRPSSSTSSGQAYRDQSPHSGNV